MRTVWEHRIRPAIIISAFVIFLFVSRGRDSSGSGGRPQSIPVHANLRQKVVQFDSVGSNYWNNQGRSLRGRLLLAGADGLSAGEGEEGAMEESVSGTYGEQLDGFSPQNDSVLNSVEQMDDDTPCENVRQHPGYPDSCSYVKAIPQCSSGTLVEYTQLFYCFSASDPILAYVGLALWLVALFYMLGNTAADFFCCAIEKLSRLLHLPPTVAGVTLLPLGNGAPDVFASIAAFVGASGQGQVGLNSVLGGAIFVSSVVAGSVSLMVARNNVPVHLDRRCFIRDMFFFIVTLVTLTTILVVGKIHFWGAIGYISIYGFYAFTVGFLEFVRSHRHKFTQWHALQPLLSGIPQDNAVPSLVSDDESGLDGRVPLLETVDQLSAFSSAVENTLPQWMWAPHVAMYSHQNHLDKGDSHKVRPLWGWSEEQETRVKWYSLRGLSAYCVEWPLTIPRRLTIPLVEDRGWSKVYAVCSATFAPTLLAMVWDGKDGGPFGSAWKEYVVAGSLGIVFGGLSFFTLRSDRPPRRYLFPWAAGGFIMSIVWFYIIASELVAALVALGVVMEIDAAILGLTVLAWGNSIGDLVSNLALVSVGGDGVQIAFSGCYAGPMFNTLMGIGLSLVLASWKAYPAPFDIPQDDSIFITLTVLMAGLCWSLYMLLSRNMQLTKPFGLGLLILYVSFFILRIARVLGLGSWLGNSVGT